jgi:predicted nucleic acid-binding protein
MIVFFDTNVHVALLRGSLSLADILELADRSSIRLSPVVASELLRGARSATRTVARLVDRLLPLEPPSWRRCWLETGRLLPRIFPHHEARGLASLQNDALIALTARYTGATLVTADDHFGALREHVAFSLRLVAL